MQQQQQGHKAQKTIFSQNESEKSSRSSRRRKEITKKTKKTQELQTRGDETPALYNKISR